FVLSSRVGPSPMPIGKLLGGSTVMLRLLEMSGRNILAGRRIEPFEATVQRRGERDGENDSLDQVLPRARPSGALVILGLLERRRRVDGSAGLPDLQPLQIGGAIAKLA